jgi:hypothetical protein
MPLLKKLLGEVSNWGVSVRPKPDDGSLARERAGPSEGGAMRYLLLIYGPEWDPTGITPEQQRASMEEWTDYTADLMKREVMEGGDALEPTNTATTVRVRNDETLTTDGPFAETNEVLGGYYLLNCKDLDEAIEIAVACPAAKNGSIELRPITEFGEEYQKAVRERAGIASS